MPKAAVLMVFCLVLCLMMTGSGQKADTAQTDQRMGVAAITALPDCHVCD